MQVLLNPQLREMSSDDLNQRYADSYCVYRGEPRYIEHFGNDGGDMYITSVALTKDKPEPELFRWDLLNVARPRSGWYLAEEKGVKVPLFLSYPIRRQWKRGLTLRNTSLHAPWRQLARTADYFQTILSAPDVVNTKVTNEDLEGNRTVIPRPDSLMFAKKPGKFQFMLRRAAIAEIDLVNKKLIFQYKGFEQELNEVCNSSLLSALAVTYDEREQKLYKPKRIPEIDMNQIQRMVQAQRNVVQQRVVMEGGGGGGGNMEVPLADEVNYTISGPRSLTSFLNGMNAIAAVLEHRGRHPRVRLLWAHLPLALQGVGSAYVRMEPSGTGAEWLRRGERLLATDDVSIRGDRYNRNVFVVPDNMDGHLFTYVIYERLVV